MFSYNQEILCVWGQTLHIIFFIIMITVIKKLGIYLLLDIKLQNFSKVPLGRGNCEHKVSK